MSSLLIYNLAWVSYGIVGIILNYLINDKGYECKVSSILLMLIFAPITTTIMLLYFLITGIPKILNYVVIKK